MRGGEQDAVVPPPEPTHVHDQGPVPETLDGVPRLQRPDDGAAVVGMPEAEPHRPFIEALGWPHFATKMPLLASVHPVIVPHAASVKVKDAEFFPLKLNALEVQSDCFDASELH